MTIEEVSKYIIIGDRPLIVLPELARGIGLEKAVILQQFHWLLRDPNNGKILPGREGRWLYNTYEEWVKQYFVWIKPRTLMRYLNELEEEEFIESCQPDGVMSRKKYYKTLVKPYELSSSSSTTEGLSSHEVPAMSGETRPRMRYRNGQADKAARS